MFPIYVSEMMKSYQPRWFNSWCFLGCFGWWPELKGWQSDRQRSGNKVRSRFESPGCLVPLNHMPSVAASWSLKIRPGTSKWSNLTNILLVEEIRLTSWQVPVVYLITSKVLYIQGRAGFLPSTVCFKLWYTSTKELAYAEVTDLQQRCAACAVSKDILEMLDDAMGGFCKSWGCCFLDQK